MTKKPLSMKRNVLFATFGNVVFALTQWGIITTVARFGTADEVGALTLSTALITPVFFLAQMGLREGHSVDDLTEYGRADYLALRMLSSVVACLVCAVAILFYLDTSNTALILTAAMFVLVKVMGAAANMNHGIMQRAERLDMVAASMIFRGITGLSIFAATYIYTRNLPLALAAEAVAWWGAGYIFDKRLLNNINSYTPISHVLQVSPAKVLKLCFWMFPLGFAIFLLQASVSMPVIFLNNHAELAAIGIFGAIAYINNALGMVSNALGAASAARLRRHVRDGQRKAFTSLMLKLFSVSFLLSILLILFVKFFGDTVLLVLYGSDFVRNDIFLITVCAAALRICASPLQFAMSAGRAFWKRFQNNSFTFISSIAASWMLIPEYGIIGAAWVLVFLSAVNFILTFRSFLGVVRRI